jgi:hypothetical protein
MVNGTELCDTAAVGSGRCPVDPLLDCPTPANACIVATIEGTGCNARCGTMMLGPADGDECCPAGASNAEDSDCEPVAECGNNIREAGEECEGSYTGTPCVSEACVTRVGTCSATCMNVCEETPIEPCMP